MGGENKNSKEKIEKEKCVENYQKGRTFVGKPREIEASVEGEESEEIE